MADHYAKDEVIEIDDRKGEDIFTKIYGSLKVGKDTMISVILVAIVIYLFGPAHPFYAMVAAIMVWFYYPTVAMSVHDEALIQSLGFPSVVASVEVPRSMASQLYALYYLLG
jgi:hypothetical protein